MSIEAYVIAHDQLKLIAGGLEPTYGNEPTPTAPPPKGNFNVGPLNVAPNVGANEYGAGASITFGIPVTDNIGFYVNTNVVTDFNHIHNPNNGAGVVVSFPFR